VYCGLVADNVVLVAIIVGSVTPTSCDNLVPKVALIAVPDDSYCGPLHLGHGSAPLYARFEMQLQ
jgi:hypothetical protein